MGSVLRQSVTDLELILVDDGSTENIRQVAESFHDPRIRYLRRDTRGGVAAARNAGVAVATGKFLAFQDSDDEWLLDKLKIQLETFAQSDADTGIVMCGLLRFDSRRLRKFPPTAAARNEITHTEILGLPLAYTQTWLVRRGLLQQAECFDEAMHVWEDWELLIRLTLTAKVRMVHTPLVLSEWRADGLTALNPRWAEHLRHVLQKHHQHIASHPRQHAQLRHVLGRLLLDAGKKSESQAELLAALRLQPGRVKTWLLLLGLTFASGVMVKALAFLDQRR